MILSKYSFERTNLGTLVPRGTYLSRGGGRGGMNMHVLRPTPTHRCSYDRGMVSAPTTPTTVITFPARNTNSQNITIFILPVRPGVLETPQFKPLSYFLPAGPERVLVAQR